MLEVTLKQPPKLDELTADKINLSRYISSSVYDLECNLPVSLLL